MRCFDNTINLHDYTRLYVKSQPHSATVSFVKIQLQGLQVWYEGAACSQGKKVLFRELLDAEAFAAAAVHTVPEYDKLAEGQVVEGVALCVVDKKEGNALLASNRCMNAT